MSCACEHNRYAKEMERVRRLAKTLAIIEGRTVAVTAGPDGSYSFGIYTEEKDNIVELITPY